MTEWMCLKYHKCWNCDNITYLSSSKHSTQCFIVAPRYCLEIGQRHEYNCTKFIEIYHICLKLATNKASCFVAVKETGLILIRVYNHSPFPFIFTNIMMTPSNGNVFRFTGPLWGESTGPRWFPLTRPVTRNSDVFLSVPEQTVEQTIETPVIWDAIAVIMTALFSQSINQAHVTLAFYQNCRRTQWTLEIDVAENITSPQGWIGFL